MTVVEPFDVEDPKAASKDGESKDKADKSPEYKKEGVIQTVRARGGWLTVFFVGLVLAALVVEEFEDVLTANVELSYFVPLLIGHGGNTGSQSVATVIRAMALKQISTRDAWVVVYKESAAGFVMGAFLGVLVYLLALCWDGLDPIVGLVVAISLPLVSLWANMLGGVLPLAATHLGYNPAVTTAPLMTTIVDSSGLVIYFLTAKAIMPASMLSVMKEAGGVAAAAS
ncbi:Mg2+ transporter-e family [Micromonas pusilla CCMP1545]|uniref:Mg2+ transporter-e family n=2 Tax=Micromonas pusilla TaxID=38833 RepID=C1MWU7_MICPC|nr:Mg2+ transporter-e family [Micromonas pusilla CCMP1545]EEH55937.1 Mg2+ transporter-e family [Micromonas pusilla CCMP1545]|eukprot:XP_003059985.1 Mg2+ transporter-e family [Micromonas pusilla CCMP1545]